MKKKYFLFAFLGINIVFSQNFSHALGIGGSLHRSSTANDTLKILAVMVQFQRDDDSRTSGNGTFDLSNAITPIVDAPPHDSAYVVDHFLFAKNYFQKASNGKQHIQATVLGKVITLNGGMRNYAPLNDNKPLAEMIEEAWRKADSVYPTFEFQKYDLFVVVHAGVGKDVDLRGTLGYDPTPLDLPSLYFNLKAFQNIFGQTFAGFSLPNSNAVITNTSVLPETEVRQIPSVGGDFTLKLGMNGLVVASIASHFGLPDLFDTKTGKTAIGRFGLMDGQSIFSFAGICPPEPSAWEKIYLGWTIPIEVYGNRNVQASAVSLYDTGIDTVFKIPISAKEYFLAENRQRDAKHNGQTVWMKWHGTLISKTYSADEEYFSNTNIDSIYGAVVDVDELDWDLPGLINANNDYHGGMVIWHIDENVIEKNIAANSINADPNHRGIDVEEADGSQDIGESYDMVSPGSGSEDGSPIDYWFSGNISPVYQNAFSETTNPNSLSNSLAKSHVTLKNFSVSQSRMTFDISVGDENIQLVKTIKRKNLKVDNNDAPIAADIDGDGKTELIFTSGDSIYVLKDDLTPFLNNSTGLFSPVGGKFQPAFYSSAVSGNPFSRGVIGAGDSTMYLLSPGDGDNNGIADIYKSLNTGSKLSTPFTARDISALGYFSAGTTDGKYIIADTNIYASKQFSSPLVSVSSFVTASADSINFNGTYRTLNDSIKFVGAVNSNIVVLSKSSISIFDSYTKELQRQFPLPAPATSLLSLGDINNDHSGDIVVGINNRLYAYNVNGSILDNFPFTISAEDKIIGSTIISGTTLIFGTKNGLIYAIDGNGKNISGFPLQTGGVVSTPVLTDRYLIVASTDSSIYFWRHKNVFSVSPTAWQTFLGSYSHSSNVTIAGTIVQKSFELLPKSLAYNWPNPVYGGKTNIRYFLGKSAIVKIKILTMSGELVEELQGTNYVGLDNEISWDVTKIQSGIYFAEITASGSGGDQQQVIKIAVVK